MSKKLTCTSHRGGRVVRADHHDVREAVRLAIADMPDGSRLEVKKVKFHLTRRDMGAGRIDKDEWELNDKPDGMAKRTGKTHMPQEEIVSGLLQRVACATLCQ